MSEIKERNATIRKTFLGFEDHGIFTCYLFLSFAGGEQGFGGYSLQEWNEEKGKSFGSACGTEFVRRILKVVGVDSWEDLPGSFCRIRQSRNKIHEIGHLIDDEWFNPEEDMKDFCNG